MVFDCTLNIYILILIQILRFKAITIGLCRGLFTARKFYDHSVCLFVTLIIFVKNGSLSKTCEQIELVWGNANVT